MRLGAHTKVDGSKIPLWRDSEVAAIAYAVIRKDGCDYCTQCGYVGTCG
jgi:ribonucleoside-diphosphate reductase alpha chain